MKKIYSSFLFLLIIITPSLTQAISVSEAILQIKNPELTREQKIDILTEILNNLNDKLNKVLEEKMYTDSSGAEKKVANFLDELEQVIIDKDVEKLGSFVARDLKGIPEITSENIDLLLVFWADAFTQQYVSFSENDQYLVASTDVFEERYPDSVYFKKASLFFKKDDMNTIKLSSLELDSRGSTLVNTDRSYEDIKEDFTSQLEDTDKDGLSDVHEKCLNILGNLKSDCFVTNHLLNDTDGDGVWDGFEDFED